MDCFSLFAFDAIALYTLMTSLALSTDVIFYVAKLIMFCAILDDAALLLNKDYCSHTVTARMLV